MKQYIYTLILSLMILGLIGCSTTSAPLSGTNDVCYLFQQHPSWYTATKNTRHKYSVPIAVQMAIINQESAFQADALPPKKYKLGVIPWGRVTSAYGYSQATDATWVHYIEQTGNRNASRSDFADADDFIGWYAYRAHTELGISRHNTYELYLAYHEGLKGYENRTYNSKPWLIDVARETQSQANLYNSQLTRCEKNLVKRHWWN